MSLAFLHDRAAALRRAGQPGEAEAIYRQILAAAPGDFTAAYQLGVMAFGQGRHADALALIETALSTRPDAVNGLIMAGLALQGLHRPHEALAHFDAALEIEPGNETAHSNRGNLLAALGRPAEALAEFDHALARDPDMVSALNNRGNVLLQLKRPDEALACFDRMLALVPDFATGWHNHGEALRQLGRPDEALASYEQALMRDPKNLPARNSRGVAFQELGRLQDAIACHREVLAQDADFADAWAALGNAWMAKGDFVQAETAWREALKHKPEDRALCENLALLLANQDRVRDTLALLMPLLKVKPTAGAGRVFAICAARMPGDARDAAFGGLLARALQEVWERPSDLAEAAGGFLAGDPKVQSAFRNADFTALECNSLLMALLTTTPNTHLELEALLARARLMLLELAEQGGGTGFGFFAALARQCFINEFVFARSDDEARRAWQLRDELVSKLDAGETPPSLLVLAVAAYVPLAALPAAERLLNSAWPEPVEALLTLALREPLEERRLASAIPSLTLITGAVSAAVHAQYEENPYPRWIKSAMAGPSPSTAAYLRGKFPLAPFQRDCPSHDILIAGCGTGQHSIATARKFPDADILAVDLSKASLAYAWRKSRELGLDQIEYAQADLLELGTWDRRFDVIECAGVLHHLADPFAGWRILAALLRPGGVMMIGLYSALGRRHVASARDIIAREGYAPDVENIRRCRQALIARDGTDAAMVCKSPDFFSLSACRDLLFHVQDHPVTLKDIAAFLRRNGLAFLGFETSIGILAAYRTSFPVDPAAIDLEHWQEFERHNPDIFASMYQFWVQKPV